MIYSSIHAHDDLSKYTAAIQRALTYVTTTDVASLAPADYPIEGDKMFAKVFDNTSKSVPETHPELHKKYIDVQFFVTGGELMGIYPKKKDYEVVEVHEDQDLYFVGDVEGEQFLRMEPGDYIILFPNDVHRPGVAEKEPQTYRKVVVKVSVDLL